MAALAGEVANEVKIGGCAKPGDGGTQAYLDPLPGGSRARVGQCDLIQRLTWAVDILPPDLVLQSWLMNAPQPSGRSRISCAVSWSGGKDSALALWALRRQGREPEALITTVTEGFDRISMHGVRRELLARQAEALGIPLVEVVIPPACVNEMYEARMAQAFASPLLSDVEEVVFGDLFLEDVRAHREERLAAGGKRGNFPLWGRDTTKLAREFIAAGFKATIVCLDPHLLDPAFAGRAYDEQLLAELPLEVDPCGENGEFHTFVHAGPMLAEPIACETGDVVERDGFIFCDLVPA